jgi:hypothetical protein
MPNRDLIAVTLLLACAALPAHAQDASGTDLNALKAQLDRQADQLDRQARTIEQQRQQLDEQRRQLQMILQQQAGPAAEAAPEPPAQAEAPAAVPSADGAMQPQNERPQDITVIADSGGVLTPPGTLTIEPILSVSHTSSNRFFFQGVEIIDAILIGAVEATETRRNYISPQVNVRFGITNRLEVSAKVPYVYRDDRVESTVISEDPDVEGEPSLLQNLDGHGLGDIELGMQLQLNNGQGGWPYLITNLRAKTRTGKGPYELKRDALGLETELPTGSGFWSLEPSLTMIFPTDPAVLFVSGGYTWNVADDINQNRNGTTIGRINPGDVITGSFGVGFALNEQVSINLGYQHNYVFGTRSVVNGNAVNTNDFQVGSFLFGTSVGLGPLAGLSMNLAIGVVEDAPDVELSLRMPFSFRLF